MGKIFTSNDWYWIAFDILLLTLVVIYFLVYITDVVVYILAKKSGEWDTWSNSRRVWSTLALIPIFGIPALIIGSIMLRHQKKKAIEVKRLEYEYYRGVLEEYRKYDWFLTTLNHVIQKAVIKLNEAYEALCDLNYKRFHSLPKYRILNNKIIKY